MASFSTFDWPAYHGAQKPNAVAVTTIDTGFELTWGELNQRTGRLAHLLASEYGIEAGGRVGLIADSDARFFEIQFALARLSAAFVPLNPRLTASELAGVIEDAGVTLVIHDPGATALAADAAAVGGLATLQWDEGPDETPYAVVADPNAPVREATRIDPDAIAQMMYTSGTTGKPKGVLITHGQMAANAVNMAQRCDVSAPDVHALNYVPLYHAGGLNIYCLPVMYWGGRVSTTKGFDPKQALDLLCDAEPGYTITNGVQQMYERFVEVDGFDEMYFPTMREMLYGGFGPAAMKTYLKMINRGPQLVFGYGSTELGPMTCMKVDATGIEEFASGSYGRPLPLTEMRIVDDNGNDLPAGVSGKIVVRGATITSGYWGRGRDGFDEDGWFSIDDVGFLDENGEIHITGRLVERYRSGGENIYPGEVEAAYLDLPGVIELAVTGVPDEKWGEVGLLALVLEPGVTYTLEQVREHATGKLASFKLPHHLVIMDELPRSTTLKIARNQLRSLVEAPASGSES